MTSRWIVLCRIATLVALAASAALYLHYLSPVDAGFCGLHSGCEAVRRSALSYFGSPFLSMPLVGLVAYGTLFIVSLQQPDGRALAILAGVGAVAAIGLIAVQAIVVGQFCWLCATVDAAAIAAGVFALLHARGGRGAQDPLVPWAWYALAGVALAAPPVWSEVKPAARAPDVIRALFVPGKINVVEFADFQCPFCRAFHPVLKKALAAYPESQVHFVRMNVPLEQHEQAEPAARAYICASAQNKADLMADALVRANFEKTPPRDVASGLGLDMTSFDRCLDDPATANRIERETQVLVDAGMMGLPTTYVGDRRFVGTKSFEELKKAMDRAARPSKSLAVPLPIYLALLVCAIAAVTWLGRRARANLEHGAHT